MLQCLVLFMPPVVHSGYSHEANNSGIGSLSLLFVCFLISFVGTFPSSCTPLTCADPEWDRGSRPPPPLKNHKNIVFL